MCRYASFSALIFSNILRFVYKTECKGTKKKRDYHTFLQKKRFFYEKSAKMEDG